MADERLSAEERQRRACGLLARLPGRLPWHLVGWAGRLPRAQQQRTRLFLEQRFAQAFPHAGAAQHAAWARAHLDMLACETLDAVALGRLGRADGPELALEGWDDVARLQREGRGFILVLNHFDRLLAAPIALARRGLRLNNITMPLEVNPDLNDRHQAFLSRKVRTFTHIIGGQWRSTDQSLRPVHESLRAGQAWIILADAWRPEFSHLREHRFLDGWLRVPTGIERLARSTGAALVQAATYSDAPGRLRIVVERLDDNPVRAVDRVIEQLDRDVRERPWAWWHWGLWDQMWRPKTDGDTWAGTRQ